MTTTTKRTVRISMVDVGGDRGPVFVCADCRRPEDNDPPEWQTRGIRNLGACRVRQDTDRSSGIACWRCHRAFTECAAEGKLSQAHQARLDASRSASNQLGRLLSWAAHDGARLRRGGGCCRDCNLRDLRGVLAQLRDHAPAIPGPFAPDPTQLCLRMVW